MRSREYELRPLARRRFSGPTWNELRWIVESSLSRTPAYAGLSRVEGRLTYRGEGIGQDNYVFEALGFTKIS